MMEREIDRFLARSDDGKYEKTIIVFQTFVEGVDTGGPHVTPSVKRARTLDGFTCQIKDDDTVEILNDMLHPAMIVQRVRQDG